MSRLVISDATFKDPIVMGQDSAVFVLPGYNPAPPPPLMIRRGHFDGGTNEWGCKGSLVFDVLFEDCFFTGGTERALDIVRGGNLTFRRCVFSNSGHRPDAHHSWAVQSQCDIGLKAGVRDVLFDHCALGDLLLGDYSIYDQIDRPRTRRITLDTCTSSRGSALPIIVRGRYAEPAIVKNCDVAQFTWPRLLTWFYWRYNRKYGDKRVISPDQFKILPEEIGNVWIRRR
jgi:hypothetical protein